MPRRPEATAQTTQICPTCSTRLTSAAARCPVCGTDLRPKGSQSLGATAPLPESARADSLPEVVLTLPIALGLLVLFLAVGGGLGYLEWSALNRPATPTLLPTSLQPPTASPTPTATQMVTPVPSATAQPPFEYTVASGDTCGGIAVQFDISVQSLIILNNLPVACNNLAVGRKLKIPYPTATPLPPPTSTFEPGDATKAACNAVRYTVQQNDTLSIIADTYGIPQAIIKEFNDLEADYVVIGRTILIPLCARTGALGPTSTATLPALYPAPDLLVPSDGAPFTRTDGEIALQWASLGVLGGDEAYEVVVEDVTAGEGHSLVGYVTDNKYIVPEAFRSHDRVPHLLRWWVQPVRKSGLDEHGQTVWSLAGNASERRDFTWIGEMDTSTP